MNFAQMYFNDANSPMMEHLIFFHEHVMFILIMIIILIFYLFMKMFYNKYYNRFLMKGHLIETIWTMIPIMLLFFLAVPSLKVLYLTDELLNPMMTVKCIGHQWYWSYEYGMNMIESFMLNMNNVARLLLTDEWIILPNLIYIRLIVSSEDVLHSFTIPVLGIKVDACPGRMNEIYMFSIRCGIFYGQCSEICGINHSFMPIMVQIMNIF